MADVPIPEYGQKPRKPPVVRKPPGVRVRRPSYTVEQQAGRDVNKAYQPVIQALMNQIQGRARTGAQAITGYTGQLGGVLGGLAAKAGDPYRQAQQGQAASDAALMQAVTGTGQDLASGLAAKLAAIQAPQAAIDQTAGAVGRNAAGSGAAVYGQGSASLSELLGREATAKDFAGKQQGIAGLTGLSAVRDLSLKAQQDIGEQTADLRSKIPGAVLDRGQEIRSNQAKQRNSELARQIAEQQFGIKTTTDRAKIVSGADQKELDRQSRERIAVGNRAAKQQAAATTRADKQQAADEKTKQTRAKAFYTLREGAFKDAAAAFGAGRTAAQVVAYLQANYGRLLLGRGFSRAQANQMIAAAVRAGRANPSVAAKAGSGSGARTGVGQQAADALGGKK